MTIKRDKRVDEYIAKQQPFAQPILTHIRDVVHQACPDCEETLKWGSPTFMYQGMLGGMAAFKAHAVFGFWKHENLMGSDRNGAMGSFGRLTGVEDLPPKREFVRLIKKAMELNEEGVKAIRAPRVRKPIPLPRELKAALDTNARAKAAYDAFSPSHKREYHEWISEAKGEDTRARRVKQAVEWIAQKKPRNWKYM